MSHAFTPRHDTSIDTVPPWVFDDHLFEPFYGFDDDLDEIYGRDLAREMDNYDWEMAERDDWRDGLINAFDHDDGNVYWDVDDEVERYVSSPHFDDRAALPMTGRADKIQRIKNNQGWSRRYTQRRHPDTKRKSLSAKRG